MPLPLRHSSQLALSHGLAFNKRRNMLLHFWQILQVVVIFDTKAVKYLFSEESQSVCTFQSLLQRDLCLLKWVSGLGVAMLFFFPLLTVLLTDVQFFMKTYVIATFMTPYYLLLMLLFSSCHKASQKPLKLQQQQHTIAVV